MAWGALSPELVTDPRSIIGVQRKAIRTFVRTALPLLIPNSSFAAQFDGTQLGAQWSIPFIGMLVSIALFPLLAPSFWHHHFGKVSAGWALAFLVPFAVQYGIVETVHQAAHTLLLEYVPFIIVLLGLYTVAGGDLRPRYSSRNAACQHIASGDWDSSRELDGHHRRCNADDKAGDPRE